MSNTLDIEQAVRKTPGSADRRQEQSTIPLVASNSIEDVILEASERAGFCGVERAKRDATPWRVESGIESRSMNVTANKGTWKQVNDDDDQVLLRGKRLAVCDKTFHKLTSPNKPYYRQIIGLAANENVQPTQPTHLAGPGLWDIPAKPNTHVASPAIIPALPAPVMAAASTWCINME